MTFIDINWSEIEKPSPEAISKYLDKISIQDVLRPKTISDVSTFFTAPGKVN